MQPPTCAATATVRIGVEGGKVLANSPTHGPVQVTIPAGAVGAPESFDVTVCSRMVAVRSGRAGGTVISIGSTATFFRAPVLIDIAYAKPGAGGLAVAYLVEDRDVLSLADIERLDRRTGRLVIATFRPGSYTWVLP